MTSPNATQTVMSIWELDPTHSSVEFSVKHMMMTTVRGRFKAALDALPPAILMAVIAPTITSGWAEAGAAAITAGAAIARLPLVVVLLVGIASILALRYALG